MEICVDSVQSALNAEIGGAIRLELCSSLEIGGVTPSIGLIKLVKERIKIPVFVLIRPRASDFLYSESELEVMINDVRAAKEFNVDGFVIGALKSDGSIDEDLCRRLINECRPSPVTFHRAVDMCEDPVKAVQMIIQLCCERILTSGHHCNAIQGKEIIRQMNVAAANRLSIMPGGGITEANLPLIIEHTNCFEFHSSAKMAIESSMSYKNPDVNMGGGSAVSQEFTRFVCDSARVKHMTEIVNQFKIK